MKTKFISIFLCFVLVLVAFSGCDSNTSPNNDEGATKKNSFFSDLFDKTPTDASDESATNGSSSNGGKVDANTNTNTDSSDETTKHSETGSGKANQNSGEKEDTNTSTFNGDRRLIGKWIASAEIPVTENGATVTSNCFFLFKEDGTFEQATTEVQARQMIIDTYLIVFNCRNEQELEAYIRINKGITLDAYVAMALAEMTDADFHIKGTWKTENDNTLYEITDEGNKKHTETIKYVFSNDGSSVNFSISDGAGGKTTMILKKA